jgi:Tfp pilus assembly protein PilX
VKNRPAFVLIAALVALFVIALLITGAFFASGQDVSISRAELRDQQTFSYAEYALAHAISDWSVADRSRMAVAETQSGASSSDDPLEGTVFVTRLDSTIYSVVAEARLTTVDATGLRRRVGLVVRGDRNPPVRIPQLGWSELY